MLFRLLFLFVTIPLVELFLLLQLADWTSALFTFLLVIVTGVAGAWIARLQGWRTFQRIQRSLEAGQFPGDALLDSLLIFVAGALLLSPGILTDLMGISLLIPFFRRFFRRRLANYFWRRIRFRTHAFHGFADGGPIIDSYVVRPRGESDASGRREFDQPTDEARPVNPHDADPEI